jgi:hypothetical protein
MAIYARLKGKSTINKWFGKKWNMAKWRIVKNNN